MRLPCEAGKLQCFGLVGEVSLVRLYFSHRISMPATLASQESLFMVQLFVQSIGGVKFTHSFLLTLHQLPVTFLEKPLSISSIN